MERKRSIKLAIAAAFVFAGIAQFAGAAPIPIVEYQFNSTTGGGTITPVSAGTVAAANATAPNLTMFGDDGVTATNRIGSVGPSGLAGDTALLAATAATSKSISKFSGDIAQLDNLKSYTMTFWIKGANISAASDRIALYGGTDGSAAGSIEAEANAGTPTGNLNIKVSNSAQATGGLYTTNQWSFVAITYDGSNGAAAVNNLLAYNGSTASFNTTPATFTNTTGTLPNPTIQQLLVGNRSSDSLRPLGYLLDDLTIYGSTTDSSGALSASDLQTVYANDLANVSSAATPEPGSLAVMGLGMLAMAGRRRRA
jgi:hypothetical protein